MTRILFIIDSLWGGGGAETSLFRLIQSLPPDRYQCRVLTFHSDELADSFISRFPCPVDHWQMVSLHHSSSLRLAWRLFRLVRDEKIDIVHSFFPVADLFAGPLAKLSGARFLISSRRDMGILRKRWHGPLYRLLKNFYNEIHAVSDEVRRYTIRTDHVQPSRIRTIYNGVDPNFDRSVQDPDSLRRELGCPPSQPIVTLVAHVRHVKGIDIFIRAAAEARKTCPNALFLIAGTFGTNVEHLAYKEEVLALTRNLGLEDTIRFLGARSDVAAVLAASDVFVLPSRSEGFSNALLEAMICGRPCVATRVGGSPELVVEGETGFLVPSEDPAAVAARIVELLADPVRRKAMGEQSRARALSNFTIGVMTARVIATYEQLMSGSPPKLPARLSKKYL